MCISVNKISIIFDFLLHFTAYDTLSRPFLSFKMLPETLQEDTCVVINTLCSISLACGRKVFLWLLKAGLRVILILIMKEQIKH